MRSLTIYLFAASIVVAAGCSSNTKNNSSNSNNNTGSTENTISTDQIDNKSTASNPDANKNKDFPVMSVENSKHNFGDIVDGETVTHKYKFTNTGNADLLINNCEVTCGCTTPEFPRTPIKPGESAEIKVGFNSSGKSGDSKTPVKISKNVQVFTNCKDNPILLEFEANVYPPKK